MATCTHCGGPSRDPGKCATCQNRLAKAPRFGGSASSDENRWKNDAILGSAMLAERINEVFGRRG